MKQKNNCFQLHSTEILPQELKKFSELSGICIEEQSDKKLLFRPGCKRPFAILRQITLPSELEIRCNPFSFTALLNEPGISPAGRINWIRAKLDGSADYKLLQELLQTAAVNPKKRQSRHIADWIIPANPKLYDVPGEFAKTDVISWKQSSNIRPGDTVYIYFAAPCSSVLYRCKAEKTDLPFDMNGHPGRTMYLRRLTTYPEGEINLDTLREHGIYAVRGPRGISYGLKCLLEAVAEKTP